MSAVNAKLTQVLFPILTVAILAAGCGGDSTGPSTNRGREGGDGTTESPVVDTTTAPVDTTTPGSDTATPPPGPSVGPPAGPTDGPPVATKASIPGAAMVSFSVASPVRGDLYPCVWSASYCYRWVSIDYPVWLQLAIQFDANFIYIWEQVWNTGRPWTLQYAVSRYDLAVWNWTGQWHRYQPNDVQLSPTTVLIGAPDGCGLGVLCTEGMLNPANRLDNGMPVVDFLRLLTTGN